MADAREYRHRASLRKAGEDNPPRAHATVVLALDERAYGSGGRADSPLVLRVGRAEAGDVEPRAHQIAGVDGDRPYRRIGEHEAHRGQLRGDELGYDRLEIVSIRTEPMHPDDAGDGMRCSFNLDRIEHSVFCHAAFLT